MKRLIRVTSRDGLRMAFPTSPLTFCSSAVLDEHIWAQSIKKMRPKRALLQKKIERLMLWHIKSTTHSLKQFGRPCVMKRILIFLLQSIPRTGCIKIWAWKWLMQIIHGSRKWRQWKEFLQELKPSNTSLCISTPLTCAELCFSNK